MPAKAPLGLSLCDQKLPTPKQRYKGVCNQNVPPPTKCFGERIILQQVHPCPPPVEPKEIDEDVEERYDRLKDCTPVGFHELLRKIIRAVILGRPVHVYRFVADMLDVELAKRTFDDIMFGCMLKKSQRLKPYPTESCILSSSFLTQTMLQIYGEDQFTMGAIPDHELDRPALDRYRDYAGIGVFDMTCCEFQPCEPIQTAESESPQEPPPCVPVETAPSAPRREELVFCRGPIPNYEMQEPALDRYRDFAGIGPFDLDGECDSHEPQCRCMFCMMKAGRSKPTGYIDQDEEQKACEAKRLQSQSQPPLDPLKVFIDSPVYRQPKVKDKDAYKDEVDAVAPFGELFQQEQQFEECVFEPESPFGEKTFTQQHPLFGDFSVDTAECEKDKFVDDEGRPLVESPECPNPVQLNDPEEGGTEEVFDDKAFEPPQEEKKCPKRNVRKIGEGQGTTQTPEVEKVEQQSTEQQDNENTEQGQQAITEGHEATAGYEATEEQDATERQEATEGHEATEEQEATKMQDIPEEATIPHDEVPPSAEAHDVEKTEQVQESTQEAPEPEPEIVQPQKDSSNTEQGPETTAEATETHEATDDNP